jgi:hypothetical protein
MGLNKGKHSVDEIDGIRCTIIESNINENRMRFLKDLLEYNKYEVKLVKDQKENAEPTYKLGITDILFNPVVDVYKRKLRTRHGHIVTPAYWLQLSEKETEAEVNYWNFKNPMVRS